MKRVLFRIFLLCVILSLFVACGESTPEPEEPTPTEVAPEPVAPTPAPEPVVAETGPDWAAINAGKISAVDSARNAALKTGAKYLFDEYFAEVDAGYEEALAAYKAGGDPEKFSKAADEYVNLYNAFKFLGKAQSDCNLAYAAGYDEIDTKNAALGEALYGELEVLAAKDPRDSAAILAKSEEIAAAYAQLVANGQKVDKIIVAYGEAVDAGAEELFAEDFDAVYDLAYDALVYYNTEGTQEEFDADADNFLNIANSFTAACLAQDAYDAIYDNGFDVYDYKDIDIGDAAVADTYDLVDAYYDSGVLDGAAIYAKISLAQASYEQSLANGYAIELLLETREEAIAVGAEEIYPEEFAAVDEYAYECLDYFNAGGTQAEFDADIDNFDALYTSFAKAIELEDKYALIIARGFDEYDVKNFNAGIDAVNAAYDIAYDTTDGKAILAKLNEADASYTAVLNNGYNIAFVLSLRENAISYGAEEFFPDALYGVDEYAEASLVAYNAGGTQDELDEDVDTCSYLYNSLIVAVDTQNAYDCIIENGYDEYDIKDVARGDKAVSDVYDLAEAPELDGLAIFETINVALNAYEQAITNCEACLAVMAVREDAISAGAEDYFPGEFATVDELAWEAVASFNAGGSQDQLDADIDNFENIYIAFINAAEAQDAYNVVVENGYDEYDVRNFNAGNAAVEEVYEIAYTTFDGEALVDKTGDAKYYYNRILDNVDMCLDVMAVRDEAVAAGAEDYFPEEFAMVDELAWEAVDYYNEAGSQKELEADAANFKNIYTAFITAVDAQDAYDVVIEEGYDFYDNKNFEAGNSAEEKVYEIAYTTFDGQDILDTVQFADDSYNKVIDNGQMIDEVIAVRDDAVEAGAEEFFPEELAVADEYAYDALDYYNTVGTQEELEADAENFTNVYKAFEEAAYAAQVYIRIVENDFQSYDRNGFEAAERAVDELEVLAYSLADGEVLLAKAEEVHAAYDKVVKNAFKKKSDAVRNEYLAVKKDADGIKANVADKQGYAEAESHMKNAEAIFARMSYEAAFAEYTTAKDAMSSVYESVLAKRNAALEALERGRARAEELSILAAQADIIAPLSNN